MKTVCTVNNYERTSVEACRPDFFFFSMQLIRALDCSALDTPIKRNSRTSLLATQLCFFVSRSNWRKLGHLRRDRKHGLFLLNPPEQKNGIKNARRRKRIIWIDRRRHGFNDAADTLKNILMRVVATRSEIVGQKF